MGDQTSNPVPDHSSGQPDLMAALEKSLSRPTWVIHLSRRTGPLTSRSEAWVGVAEDREAANAAALAWVQDPAYYVSYADGPFVAVRERDRLQADATRLAEGLRARGIIPGRNPDGVNDDAEKALTLYDDAMADRDRLADLVVEHETALGVLKGENDRLAGEVERLREDLGKTLALGTDLSAAVGFLPASSWGSLVINWQAHRDAIQERYAASDEIGEKT